MKFSQYQIRILRKLASGVIPSESVRRMDQRPLRSLFLRGMFTFTRRLDAQITQAGWKAWSACHLGPKVRKCHTDPTFVESSDSRTFKHMRRVN